MSRGLLSMIAYTVSFLIEKLIISLKKRWYGLGGLDEFGGSNINYKGANLADNQI